MANSHQRNKKFKTISELLYLIILLAAPIVFIILPADYFDTGKSICLSVLLFNKTCPGCGMTRAVQHLIHFDFAEAFQYNKMCFIVFPLVVYLWGKEVWQTYKKVKNLLSVNGNCKQL